MAARNEFWRYSSRNRMGHETHPITAERAERILDAFAGGMTVDGIAESLDLDLSTVKAHLRRARMAGDARARRRSEPTEAQS